MHPAAGLHVVETESGEAWLGVLVWDGDRLRVSTGMAGRPLWISLDEIDDIIPAENHPDVEVLGPSIPLADPTL